MACSVLRRLPEIESFSRFDRFRFTPTVAGLWTSLRGATGLPIAPAYAEADLDRSGLGDR